MLSLSYSRRQPSTGRFSSQPLQANPFVAYTTTTPKHCFLVLVAVLQKNILISFHVGGKRRSNFNTCNFETIPNSTKSMHSQQIPGAIDNSPRSLSFLNPNPSLTSLYNFPETDLRQE